MFPNSMQQPANFGEKKRGKTAVVSHGEGSGAPRSAEIKRNVGSYLNPGAVEKRSDEEPNRKKKRYEGKPRPESTDSSTQEAKKNVEDLTEELAKAARVSAETEVLTEDAYYEYLVAYGNDYEEQKESTVEVEKPEKRARGKKPKETDATPSDKNQRREKQRELAKSNLDKVRRALEKIESKEKERYVAEGEIPVEDKEDLPEKGIFQKAKEEFVNAQERIDARKKEVIKLKEGAKPLNGSTLKGIGYRYLGGLIGFDDFPSDTLVTPFGEVNVSAPMYGRQKNRLICVDGKALTYDGIFSVLQNGLTDDEQKEVLMTVSRYLELPISDDFCLDLSKKITPQAIDKISAFASKISINVGLRAKLGKSFTVYRNSTTQLDEAFEDSVSVDGRKMGNFTVGDAAASLCGILMLAEPLRQGDGGKTQRSVIRQLIDIVEYNESHLGEKLQLNECIYAISLIAHTRGGESERRVMAAKGVPQAPNTPENVSGQSRSCYSPKTPCKKSGTSVEQIPPSTPLSKKDRGIWKEINTKK